MASFEDQARFAGAVALAETDKALKVRLDEDTVIWMPKNQIDDDSEVWKVEHEGELVVSQWIAEQKGLV